MLGLVSFTATPAGKISLDQWQREAVEHGHGPMVVVAGAGTGKTTVLIQRIAHLIREGQARPDQILALTYTDNAAEEMRHRVHAELAGTNISGLQTCTFHAWCHGLLQRHGAAFQVLDDKDLWVFLRRRIRELHLQYFVRAANVGQFLSDLLDFMRRCEDELVGPEQYAEYVCRLERGEILLPRVAKSKQQAELDNQEILERCREIARVFRTVEEMMRTKNLGTFGHMITGAHHLLENNRALLEEERGRIRFLLVDEFQDANFAQVEILKLLASPEDEPNIFVVGDPDQAIYMFRGASSEAFRLFRSAFPKTREVRLQQNRRSLIPVLQCAYGIIKENRNEEHCLLNSWREAEARRGGESLFDQPVDIVTWRDKEVEAADVARRIQKLRRDLRCEWKSFAVLYRQHGHRDELVKELTERNIPFTVEGLDVLDTPEVRDVMACLSAAVNPKDAASLFRVAALAQFSVDPTELKAAMRAVRRDELDLPRVLAGIPNTTAVLASVAAAHAEVEQAGVTAQGALNIVLRQFGLARTPAVRAFADFMERWQKSAVTETGQPAEFLEYLGYFRQAKGSSIPLPASTDDGARLMTAHAAKGLEFDHVTIIRGSSTSFPCPYKEPLVDFPQQLRRSPSAHSDKELSEREERRLFYVAMTRARDRLAIYAKKGKGTDATPTKFLREFLCEPAYRKFRHLDEAKAIQDTLFAAEEQERMATEHSRVAAWLLSKPGADFVTGLSASSIQTYEDCPLRFKMEGEWNLPRDVPASLHYGAAMHRVLQTFYDAQLLKRQVDDDDLLENFRADLATAGIADRYQYELYLRQGREQLAQFLAWSRSGPKPDVMQTELRFDLTVADIKLRGRIDRIDRVADGGVAIVDYKTGKPKSDEDADKSLQLSLYALAARDRGWRADRLLFHNLEDNTIAVTTRESGDLDAAQERVKKAAENIAAGKFPANPGYQCNFCPYRNLCPATERIAYMPQRKSGATRH